MGTQITDKASWSTTFDGDILSRLEAFEREASMYAEMTSSTAATDVAGRPGLSYDLKIGTVLANLSQGSIRDHLIMSSERLATWAAFRTELEQIFR
eukprot:6409481-Karenia_brevis.AAC.1